MYFSLWGNRFTKSNLTYCIVPLSWTAWQFVMVVPRPHFGHRNITSIIAQATMLVKMLIKIISVMIAVQLLSTHVPAFRKPKCGTAVQWWYLWLYYHYRHHLTHCIILPAKPFVGSHMLRPPSTNLLSILYYNHVFGVCCLWYFPCKRL